MRRSVALLSMMFPGLLLAGAKDASEEITFHKDVLPVLEKRCQGCHRPGEAAPMPLVTYQQARPWAKAIREAVLSRRMPPWFADESVSRHFENSRALDQQEIATLARWAETGAREGTPDPNHRPPAFVEGWNIGVPDTVFTMPVEFKVAASGDIEYHYLIIPTGFTEDQWVEKTEVRPGDRSAVHHVLAFIREPESKWLREYPAGVAFVPDKGTNNRGDTAMLAGYAPGFPPEQLRPGQAKLVKAGSDIVLQLHYTTNGKATTDRSSLGIVYAKQPPRERVMTLAAANGDFSIPPGAPNHRVEAKATFARSVRLTGLLPHMHLRGKAFEYRLVYPDGKSELLLSVPRFDFNWQLSYMFEEPLVIPEGARLETAGFFDNSPNNPFNPDPGVEVKWGDQTHEEMMIGFFDVAFPADQDPKGILAKKKQKEATD